MLVLVNMVMLSSLFLLQSYLNGVIETANKSVETFEKILELEKEYEQMVQQMGSRSANAMKLLNSLYENPITDARKVARLLIKIGLSFMI